MNRIPIEQARDLILSQIPEITESETVRVFAALGRICAEDIRAPVSAPAFPRSAMDGYAVRASDIADASEREPAVLKVTGELFAGDCMEIRYAPRTAVRVMTGAWIPDGYDCVVMQEDTDCGESAVSVFKPVHAYTNYCPAGEEFAVGDLLMKKGTRIGRIEEYLLCSAGIAEVRVIRQPLISVYSTGSELVSAGDPLKKGQIYNGLEALLCASVKNMGLQYADRNSCADDIRTITENIRIGLSCSDLVITTGGVSVGKKDLLPEAMAAMGAEILFHGTDIQPGTPTMASVLEGRVILSLSGNPYAALANFDYYLPYIAAKLTGSSSFLTEEKTAVLADPYPKANRLRRFVRAGY